MKSTIDPRVKLLIIICLSTLGLFFSDIKILMLVFLIGLILSILFKGSFFSLLKRIRMIFYVFLVMVILQSIFQQSGTPYLTIGTLSILTDEGLLRAAGYLMRVLIILISGVIIATCDMRRMIQGLIQMGLPYDFAFMTSIGIRFLPLMLTEMKDTLTAIQLRGIDIKKLPVKQRIDLLSYILTPVVASTLTKAKKLSLSVECRGFRAYNHRTSIITLKLSPWDYVVVATTLFVTAGIFYLGISL